MEKIILKIYVAIKHFLAGIHPAKAVALGYLTYLFAGWLFLCLPFMHKANPVSAMDNLFIAASAISTTGLTTVSISDSYTFWGQIVLLALIQFGGIGYMTFGSFVILSRKHSLSSSREKIGKTVFSLPSSFRVDKFIKSVIIFTLIIEACGAIALFSIFYREGVAYPLWSAIFHSISAFCTAGFSLYNSSFEAFSSHFWLNFIISALAYLGAIGFIVFVDFWRKLSGKSASITLTSKIIIWTSFWLWALGVFLIYLGEPSIRSITPEQRLLDACFQAMTAITTVGFNTINIGALSKATLLVIIVLMVVGASPSGTGGGLKSTTFTALLGLTRSVVRGEKEVRFWKNPIPMERIWVATASLVFYLFLLITGT